MNLIVTQSAKSRGILHWRNRRFNCALGRSGITDNKVEGDGATPIGIFPLRNLYYRQDRIADVPTKLQKTVVTKDMGWCDDLDHTSYNLPLTLPHPARHENLWRDDGLYDLFVPMGYNDDPIISGKGSCIFMHIAGQGYSPTEGCVALNKPDLLVILNDISPKTAIEVRG